MSVLQSFRDIMHGRPPREFVMPKSLTAPADATPIELRPCTLDDEDELQTLRWRNQAWLSPWDSDDPLGGPGLTFNQWVCELRRRERDGSGALFLITEHGRIVGQVSLGAITYGAMRTGLVGYWVDEAVAGRGIAPLAVAIVADWAFDCPDGPRLHRIEIAIIPDNHRSRRVAEKLGAIDEGVRRQYMHVNGRWRDHESYVLFAQERPSDGLAAAFAARGQVPPSA